MFGGTAPDQVKQQLQQFKEQLSWKNISIIKPDGVERGLVERLLLDLNDVKLS